MQSGAKNQVITPKKRFRSAFTTEQVNYLEELFKISPYIDREKRSKIASLLNIGDIQIKTWYQNRRMKEKRAEFDNDNSDNEQWDYDDQENVIPVLPSTNDILWTSLPILTYPADTTSTNNVAETRTMQNKDDKNETNRLTPKVDTIDTNQASASSPKITTKTEEESTAIKANFYNEVNNEGEPSTSYCNQNSFNNATSSLLSNKNSKITSKDYHDSTSAEFSINLCKKYEDRTQSEPGSSGIFAKVEIKLDGETNTKPKEMNNEDIPKDLAGRKKKEVPKTNPPPPHQMSWQRNSRNQMTYYPLIPNMYSAQLTSMPPSMLGSGGVVWNPYMPVMSMSATNPLQMNAVSYQAPPGRRQPKKCECDCHERNQNIPITFSQTLPNPFTPLVFPPPTPNTTSSI